MSSTSSISQQNHTHSQNITEHNNHYHNLCTFPDLSIHSNQISNGMCKNNYHVNEVPLCLRESFIHSGYRPLGSSFLQCLKSLFQWNNETINIWTHLMPGSFFLYQFISHCFQLTMETIPFYFPFCLFLLGSAMYSLMSSFAHTFNVMSLRARHIWFFFDYAGLSFCAHGVGVMYYAYCLPHSWIQQNNHFITTFLIYGFLPLSILTSTWCVVFASRSRFLAANFTTKLLRLSAFALPYVYNNLPMFYRLFYCNWHNLIDSTAISHLSCQSSGLQFWYLQLFLASTAAFFYASHLPERLWPGHFDILGHSHQILHIAGSIATYSQFYGARLDLIQRKNDFQKLNFQANFEVTYYSTMLVILINALAMAYFYCSLRVILRPNFDTYTQIDQKSK